VLYTIISFVHSCTCIYARIDLPNALLKCCCGYVHIYTWIYVRSDVCKHVSSVNAKTSVNNFSETITLSLLQRYKNCTQSVLFTEVVRTEFSLYKVHVLYLYIETMLYIYIIQGVPGGKDLTSGECSLGQTIPI